MLLDIIIPQYKETEGQIKKLLSSIENQVGFNKQNMRVTIVNDCSNTILSEEFLRSFDLELQYLRTETNGGPGLARQYGIDHTDADFFTFIDGDDILFGNFVLAHVFSYVAAHPEIDYFITNILEEIHNPNGNIMFQPLKENLTWMHGKFYRRKAYEEAQLRFHPDLCVHEDVYFNNCLLRGGRVMNVPIDSYIWLYNPNSLVRTNPLNYMFKEMPCYLKALDYTIQYMQEHGKQWQFIALSGIFYGYYNLQKDGIEPADYDNNVKCWRAFYDKYCDVLALYSPAEFAFVQQQQREEAIRTGFITEKESFKEFVAKTDATASRQ